MSLKIILTKKYVSDELGTLALQSIINRDKVQKSIPIKMTKINFDNYFVEELNGFKKNPYFNYIEVNNKIKEAINGFNHNGTIYKETVDNDDSSNNNKSYITWYKKQLELIGVPNTKLKYSDFLRKLEKYLITNKKTDLLFIDIDNEWVELFFNWLRKNGLSSNTARDYISLFRKMINVAERKEYYNYLKSPFRYYDSDLRPKKEFKAKVPMNDEHIKKLLSIRLTGEHKKDKLIYFRDMFLFQMYMNGSRMSDTFFLRWEDVHKDRIHYKMMKTNKEMDVFLNINICHILNRILKSLSLYKVIVETTRTVVGHNIELLRSNKNRDLNINEFNRLLRRNDIILGDELPIRGGDTDNNEMYRGYYFSRSIMNDAKELIDIRYELVNTIEENYATATYQNIRTKCSNRTINKTDFIFEKFVKDKLSKTFKSYTKEKEFDAPQFKRYKALQTSYNNYLKRIEDEYDFDIHLSSHIARHSFINFILRDGANLYDIMQLSGHSELGTLENYISHHFQGKEKGIEISKGVSRKYQMVNL